MDTVPKLVEENDADGPATDAKQEDERLRGHDELIGLTMPVYTGSSAAARATRWAARLSLALVVVSVTQLELFAKSGRLKRFQPLPGEDVR